MVLILPTRKRKKQELFSDPPMNSGHWVNNCPENWRERRRRRITSSWKQKPNNKSPLLETVFLFTNLTGRKEEDEIFKAWKQENHQPRNLHPVKLSFSNEGEIMTFSDKQEQREFVTSRPTLQDMSKEVFQRQERWHR